ncbi:hypothetical protein BU25DRAFT_415623 [Macroventuria anomochaeta]|uniref:Uncharacterized protein n=1 Tax=Macroventuria anomochaeta TaxID=301207 RepID=A0ACB6RL93_9PLEO|nr:uncharacterized protein BU25DRAFT_415623 [Macroventuria anomochaeta]KAF2621929.1 hypothetical protein BU25DRAFT_415623 [Macroventuria anomochaeta]
MYRAHGVGRQPHAPTPRLPPPMSNRGLSNQTRLNICRFLLLGWNHQTIANCEGCSLHAVRNVEDNLVDSGSVQKVPTGVLGRPSKIDVEDGGNYLTVFSGVCGYTRTRYVLVVYGERRTLLTVNCVAIPSKAELDPEDYTTILHTSQ